MADRDGTWGVRRAGRGRARPGPRAALAALVLCALAAAPAAHAQTVEIDAWSATLTVGAELYMERRWGGYGPSGFSDDLSPKTFTYGGTDYTVDVLGVRTPAAERSVIFGTTPDLPEGAPLVLRIPTLVRTATTDCPDGGTEDYALSDAAEPEAGLASSDVQWDGGSCLDGEDWKGKYNASDSDADPSDNKPTSPVPNSCTPQRGRGYRSSNSRLLSTSRHSASSSGGSLASVIFGHTSASSAFRSMNSC